MAALPSLVYDYGLQQAKLEDTLAKKEMQLELETNKLSAQKRVQIRNLDKKKEPTETRVKNQVKVHPTIVKLREEILELERKLRIAKLRVKSLTYKKDMVENISHNIRKEREASE